MMDGSTASQGGESVEGSLHAARDGSSSDITASEVEPGFQKKKLLRELEIVEGAESRPGLEALLDLKARLLEAADTPEIQAAYTRVALLTQTVIAAAVTSVLLQLVKKGREDDRFKAAFTLRYRSDPGVVDCLLGALEDISDAVASTAAESLAHVGDASALERMCEICSRQTKNYQGGMHFAEGRQLSLLMACMRLSDESRLLSLGQQASTQERIAAICELGCRPLTAISKIVLQGLSLDPNPDVSSFATRVISTSSNE